MKQLIFSVLFFVFCCCFPSTTFGAKLNANEGVEKIISQHEKTRESFLKLFDSYQENDFSDELEWNRFLKKLVKNDKINKRSDFLELCFNIAQKYGEGQKYQEAYYFLYIVLNEEKNVNTSTKKYLANFHEKLGQTYYFFRRFDLSEKHLNIALKHPSISKKSKIQVYNTLSLIYRDDKDNKKSVKYIQEAYQQAVEIGDTVWIGILSGNLGYIAFKNKEYTKAKELINIDYSISSKNNQKFSQLHSLELLIQFDLLDNNISEAHKKLTLFDSLIKNESSTEMFATYYKAKTNYYEKVGEYKLALINFRKLMNYKEKMDTERQFLNIENAQFQIEFEKKQGENIVFQEKKKKDDLIILGLFVICLILGATSFIIIKQIQRKRFQDKELLEFRAQKIETELIETEREMRDLLSTMFDKNKVIFELQEQVDYFEKHNISKTDAEKESMLNSLQSFSLFSENDWIKFKPLFEKLNPGFFGYFQNHFPDITSAEIRLAALIKLNLTKLEIARTLAISPESVRKTNLRLRKRLKIESLDDLDKFIKTVSFDK